VARRRKKDKRKKKPCMVCNGKAHGECGYCLPHLPEELRCVCITQKGRQCKLPKEDGLDVCKVHLVATKRGRGAGKYGWVYVYDTAFRENGKGIYKIGRSINPKTRAYDLGAANPCGKILFAGFVGSQAKTLEGRFHRQHKESWLEREMFILTDFEVGGIRAELQEVATKWYEPSPSPLGTWLDRSSVQYVGPRVDWEDK
jgi:hypothetical protein